MKKKRIWRANKQNSKTSLSSPNYSKLQQLKKKKNEMPISDFGVQKCEELKKCATNDYHSSTNPYTTLEESLKPLCMVINILKHLEVLVGYKIPKNLST